MCAPPSWITGAPITGFSPPAPYAHEIRGGVLNRLERERVMKKVVRRKREEEEVKRENERREGGREEEEGGERKRRKVEEKIEKKEWKEGEIQLSEEDMNMLEKLKEEVRGSEERRLERSDSPTRLSRRIFLHSLRSRPSTRIYHLPT